jgi:hypothetical protein
MLAESPHGFFDAVGTPFRTSSAKPMTVVFHLRCAAFNTALVIARPTVEVRDIKVMQSLMFGRIHDSQILDSIVSPITVDVVNMFVLFESASDMRLHNKTVFTAIGRPVAGMIRIANQHVSMSRRAPWCITVKTEESRMAGLRAKTARFYLRLKRHPALRALMVVDALRRRTRTGTRTEVRISMFDIPWSRKKCLAALFTGTGNGTLLGHREPILSGVTPPTVSAVRGFSYV